MIEQRRFLYAKVSVDGDQELDYLRTKIPEMNLSLRSTFRVTQQYVGRIDLVSYKFYNSFDFGWLILEFNDIMDPYDDIQLGTVLQIPNIEDYFSFFNRNARSR